MSNLTNDSNNKIRIRMAGEGHSNTSENTRSLCICIGGKIA